MLEDSGGNGDVAGVIAPPPLIFLGFLVLGLAVGYAWPLSIVGNGMPAAARIGTGVAVAAISVAVGLLGFRQLRNAGTNVRPDRPTTRLVIAGLYRYTRNPLYTSMAFLYAGIAVAADSLWALAFLV